ncbi:Isocitrate dehydrogenase [NAD] catalytic subunit 5 [Arachis hypogaea]|uniref:Isocitrate dehydrogenase [NAD] catalytic subunit 5 n=1 Tax=Arachis hypogaea TaxID=3818 RepID=A0A6B9V756_ARAHY|nr:Isocitrate dehydrogenase [NAD] catalytic subunit 5 [Arachis hypogaea]
MIRENTEGEYSGLEHQVVRGVVESLKINIRQASLRVDEYAFHYAKKHGRGYLLFTRPTLCRRLKVFSSRCCREVAVKYLDIKLVKIPALFDVLVMPNLYGRSAKARSYSLIISHHSVILIHTCFSCNIGEGGIALAEAVYGSAPDIAGKNMGFECLFHEKFGKSNCFTAEWCSMLRHLNLHDKADLIQNAILNTIAEGKYQTADLGGKAKTTEFTNAIIDHL